MTVLMRNVSEETWRSFKAEAAKRGLTIGELFEEMVHQQLSESERAKSAWNKILKGGRMNQEEALRMKKAVEEFREGFEFDAGP